MSIFDIFVEHNKKGGQDIEKVDFNLQDSRGYNCKSKY